MTNTEITIGIINYACDITRLCTIGDLHEEVLKRKSVFTPKQYCDWRYRTNLTRFIYDPFTGKKIDWKEILEFLEK